MAKKAVVPRQWARDEEKEKYWRGKFAAWKESGTSVRAFCSKHSLPESSFNAWRREIVIRDRENSLTGICDGDPLASSVPAKVKDSRGRLIPARFREQPANTPAAPQKQASPFVPLQVIQSAPAAAPVTAPSITSMEIVTPAGSTLRIAGNTDITFITALVQSLEKQKC